jgi:uncharacterized protein (TIGR00251 family)
MSAGDALLHVRVVPRGGRDTIVGWEGEALRVRVAAAPADGKANAAVVALLARAARVPKSEVTIVRGASSREKWVRVDALDAAAIRGRIAAAAG